MKCPYCEKEIEVHKFTKPFSVSCKASSVVIVDAAGKRVCQTESGNWAGSKNSARTDYILAALNAYEPPQETPDETGCGTDTGGLL
mgnify:CR=1 FL=1